MVALSLRNSHNKISINAAPRRPSKKCQAPRQFELLGLERRADFVNRDSVEKVVVIHFCQEVICDAEDPFDRFA